MFRLSPGKTLVMLSQERLNTRNASVAEARVLDTSGGSWCTDPASVRSSEAPTHFRMALSWPSSQSSGYPCCLCPFFCQTFSFHSYFYEYARILALWTAIFFSDNFLRFMVRSRQPVTRVFTTFYPWKCPGTAVKPVTHYTTCELVPDRCTPS